MKTALVLLATISLTAQAQAVEPEHPIAAEVAGRLADASRPFMLLVELQVAPEQADELIKAMAKPTRETHKEAGNLAYELSRDPKDAGRFVLYERWQNVAALDSHLQQPYLVALLSDFQRLLAKEPKLSVLELVRFDE